MTVSRGLLLKVLALVCFILDVIIVLGKGTLEWQGALVPAGLAFWVASEV